MTDSSPEFVLSQLFSRRTLSGEPNPELIPILAPLMRQFLEGPRAGEFFRLWEDAGVHLTPVHFYQPIPDTRTLDDSVWRRESTLPGVDMNDTGQLEWLDTVPFRYRSELERIPADRDPLDEAVFYYRNGAYEWTDAMVLHCMVRHLRPKLILEVGSGIRRAFRLRPL